MTITGTNALIFQVIDKISNFLIKDSQIGKDFRNFSQVEYKSVPQDELRNRTLTYLFSRKINHKSVFDFFEEKVISITSDEKNVIKALKNSFTGVFRIEKLLQDGFELYSIINERNYTVKTVGARTNYRGAYVGAFLFCCLCKIDEDYYTCDLRAITGSDKEGGAFRYAITKIVENPNLVFFDNPQKLTEIKNQIDIFEEKFAQCFHSNEIITTNKSADELINAFNDFCDFGSEEINSIVAKGINKPSKFGYFPTKDFNFTTEDFEKKSIAGFSSQGSEYDVGIIFIQGAGLFAIPFYGTFCKIFDSDDYHTIENYADCIKNFLHNDKIQKAVLKFVADKYQNFASRISEILDEKYTIDDIFALKTGKIDTPDISPASILYSSKVFSSLMLKKEPQKPAVEKVGRNDLCPCGSGKKYKKCCGK